MNHAQTKSDDSQNYPSQNKAMKHLNVMYLRVVAYSDFVLKESVIKFTL
jgi:hypothetical protein